MDTVDSFPGGKATGKTVWWIPYRIIIPASNQFQLNVSIACIISGFNLGRRFCYLQVCACEKILYLWFLLNTVLCHFKTGYTVTFSFRNVSVIFVLNCYTSNWSPYVHFLPVFWLRVLVVPTYQKKIFWKFLNGILCHILSVRIDTTTSHWTRYWFGCVHLSSVQLNTLQILIVI